MKLLNLSGAVCRIPVGNEGVRVEDKTITNNIVLTPSIVKGAILPLINLYGTKIKIAVNSSELGVLDTIGVPSENVVSEEQLKQELAKALNAPKVDPKVEVKVDKPEVEVKTEDTTRKVTSTAGNVSDIKPKVEDNKGDSQDDPNPLKVKHQGKK